MGKMEVELLSKILKELKTEIGLAICLCPGYSQGLNTSGENGCGFKLCLEGESPVRRLNLILDLHLPKITETQISNIEEQIRQAVLAFWDGMNKDPNSTVTIVQ
jgi:hypothetical protein